MAQPGRRSRSDAEQLEFCWQYGDFSSLLPLMLKLPMQVLNFQKSHSARPSSVSLSDLKALGLDCHDRNLAWFLVSEIDRLDRRSCRSVSHRHANMCTTTCSAKPCRIMQQHSPRGLCQTDGSLTGKIVRGSCGKKRVPTIWTVQHHMQYLKFRTHHHAHAVPEFGEAKHAPTCPSGHSAWTRSKRG